MDLSPRVCDNFSSRNSQESKRGALPPGLTSGWPMAPRKMESNFLNSSIALSGKISPVRLALTGSLEDPGRQLDAIDVNTVRR